jgi:hypothetical protein
MITIPHTIGRVLADDTNDPAGRLHTLSDDQLRFARLNADRIERRRALIESIVASLSQFRES